MTDSASYHIVRQYGRTGGMERYVWELTHALARQGQQVRIVCEKLHEPVTEAIEVIELGVIKPKPRWLSMLRFSARISEFFKAQNTEGWVIHSHERTAVHHVTTFHGPPILSRKKRALDFLSPRLQTWEYLERRELCSESVISVLPNSIPVAEQLSQYYPIASEKIGAPAYPGVDPLFSKLPRQSDGKTIGFIGKEWQRKGLDFASLVIAQLRKQNPEIRFLVAGPAADEVRHLFADWPTASYELLGWCRAEEVLPKIDLLIHPARVEPFGMVMAEANAAGIPIVISDHCGIKTLITEDQGTVLPLKNTSLWGKIIKSRLNQSYNVTPLGLTWGQLAQQHQQLYRTVLQG